MSTVDLFTARGRKKFRHRNTIRPASFLTSYPFLNEVNFKYYQGRSKINLPDVDVGKQGGAFLPQGPIEDREKFYHNPFLWLGIIIIFSTILYLFYYAIMNWTGHSPSGEITLEIVQSGLILGALITYFELRLERRIKKIEQKQAYNNGYRDGLKEASKQKEQPPQQT